MDNQLTKVMETLKTLCHTYGLERQESGVTVCQLLDSYLKSIEGKGSPRAFAGKVSLAKKMLLEPMNNGVPLGIVDTGEITLETMSGYVNSWSTKTYQRYGQEWLYSQSHIDKVYNNLNCAFRFGVQTGLLSNNVIDNIDCPLSRRFEEDDNVALEEWELQEVLFPCKDDTAIMDAFWYVMKILLLYTGARPGEVFAFSFSDFDYCLHTVKFRRALSLDVVMDTATKKRISSRPYLKNLKNEVNGKRDYARRQLTISSFVTSTVLWYKHLLERNPEVTQLRRKHKTTPYLFALPSDGQMKRPDYYCNAYRNHLLLHGVEPARYNMYRFRHTFCTRLFKVHRFDPKTVQLLMGDNSMDMVIRVYHSVNKDDLLMASNDYSKGLDTLFSSALKNPGGL